MAGLSAAAAHAATSHRKKAARRGPRLAGDRDDGSNRDRARPVSLGAILVVIILLGMICSGVVMLGLADEKSQECEAKNASAEASGDGDPDDAASAGGTRRRLRGLIRRLSEDESSELPAEELSEPVDGPTGAKMCTRYVYDPAWKGGKKQSVEEPCRKSTKVVKDDKPCQLKEDYRVGGTVLLSLSGAFVLLFIIVYITTNTMLCHCKDRSQREDANFSQTLEAIPDTQTPTKPVPLPTTPEIPLFALETDVSSEGTRL